MMDIETCIGDASGELRGIVVTNSEGEGKGKGRTWFEGSQKGVQAGLDSWTKASASGDSED